MEVDYQSFKKIAYKPNNDIPFPDIIYDIPSFHVSWYLLKLGLTANQTSVLGLLFGLVSAPLFLFNSSLSLGIGAVLLFLSHLFDASDGKIARYRTHKNLPDEPLRKYGGFFDWMSNIVIPVVLICMTIGVVYREESPLFFIVGILSSFFTFFNYGLLHLIESIMGKKGTQYKKKSILRGYIGNVCTFPFYIGIISILQLLYPAMKLVPIFVLFYLFAQFLLYTIEQDERDVNKSNRTKQIH